MSQIIESELWETLHFDTCRLVLTFIARTLHTQHTAHSAARNAAVQHVRLSGRGKRKESSPTGLYCFKKQWDTINEVQLEEQIHVFKGRSDTKAVFISRTEVRVKVVLEAVVWTAAPQYNQLNSVWSSSHVMTAEPDPVAAQRLWAVLESSSEVVRELWVHFVTLMLTDWCRLIFPQQGRVTVNMTAAGSRKLWGGDGWGGVIRTRSRSAVGPSSPWLSASAQLPRRRRPPPAGTPPSERRTRWLASVWRCCTERHSAFVLSAV